MFIVLAYFYYNPDFSLCKSYLDLMNSLGTKMC